MDVSECESCILFFKKWKLDRAENHKSLFTKGQFGRMELLYIWLEAAGVPVRKEALAGQCYLN